MARCSRCNRFMLVSSKTGYCKKCTAQLLAEITSQESQKPSTESVNEATSDAQNRNQQTISQADNSISQGLYTHVMQIKEMFQDFFPRFQTAVRRDDEAWRIVMPENVYWAKDALEKKRAGQYAEACYLYFSYVLKIGAITEGWAKGIYKTLASAGDFTDALMFGIEWEISFRLDETEQGEIPSHVRNLVKLIFIAEQNKSPLIDYLTSISGNPNYQIDFSRTDLNETDPDKILEIFRWKYSVQQENESSKETAQSQTKPTNNSDYVETSSVKKYIKMPAKAASVPHTEQSTTPVVPEKQSKEQVPEDSSTFQLTKEQADVLQLLENTNDNYFVTGKAGTGKSTILTEFVNTTKKKNLLVVAFTGAAALNINGQTIHSLFHMSFDPQDTSCKDDIHLDPGMQRILSKAEVLVIDEVSMVRADIMDMMDVEFQIARKNDLPFGGCQVIAFGDLYQLAPIAATPQEKSYLIDRYGTVYFFGAPSVESFITVELQTVVRQKDPEFVEILNKIRTGSISGSKLDQLNNRCLRPAPDDWLRLTLTKDMALNINLSRLAQIDGKEYTFNTELSGISPPSKEDLPFDFELRIKAGAKVMVTKNYPGRKLVNGSIGYVTAIQENAIIVKVNGVDYPLIRDVFEKRAYAYDRKEKKLKAATVGKAVQFPLRLAYAITVHKSQGLTYDNVIIDFTGTSSFSAGQTYVALSRCRTLDGIRFTRALRMNDILVSKEVIKYMNRNASQPIVPYPEEVEEWKPAVEVDELPF